MNLAVTELPSPADDPPIAVLDDLPPQLRRLRTGLHLSWRGLAPILFFSIIALSLYGGLRVRRWAWNATEQVHFTTSVTNALRWGHFTNDVGILKVYDKLIDEDPDQETDNRGRAPIALDYPPLRLFIMTTWAGWTEKHFPQRYGHVRWISSYEFNWPMLWLNTGCEIAGALAMFVLVRYWIRHCNRQLKPFSRDPFSGAWPALLAALLLWFNPAIILNAHAYPQWDVWLLAPFLLAVYLGLRNLWLPAGLIIGAIAMGKGQILIITPVFLMWQILSLRPLAVFSFVSGLALGVAAVASPWLVGTGEPSTWLLSFAMGLGALAYLFFQRDRSERSLILSSVFFLVSCVLILWPWYVDPHRWGATWMLCLVLGLALLARFLPLRMIASWAAAGIATALFLCIPYFNGSTAWYKIGLEFGTHHWKRLSWCNAINLGALLQDRYHWTWAQQIRLSDYWPHMDHPWTLSSTQLHWIIVLTILGITAICLKVYTRRAGYKTVRAAMAPLPRKVASLQEVRPAWLISGAAILILIIVVLLLSALPRLLSSTFTEECTALLATINGPWIMPIRYLMIGGYALCLLLCAVGITRHIRRRDPRLLFAIVAPWVVMFAILPQMLDRYLVWSAAFSAAAAAISIDGFLLYLVVTAISFANTAFWMLFHVRHSELAIRWLHYLEGPNEEEGGIYPDLAWAVLVLAGVWMCYALTPSRKKRPIPAPA